jgi:hypothetical protein
MLPPPPDVWERVFTIEQTASRSSIDGTGVPYASPILESRNEQAGQSRRRPLAAVASRSVLACNSMVARDITLPVEPDEAWDALTDPELLEQWFGDGEREAVVEEAEPGERLVFWWWEEGEPGSRVELRLIAVPDGTRVSVREAPVGPFALAGA